MKAKLIMLLIKILMGATALGIGIWYLSSSIGGAAITYTSMDGFLRAIGVENGDISSANGCFLCRYIQELFNVIGEAAEFFWTAMVDNLWIILALGFGLFLFIHTWKTIKDASQATAKLDDKEKKIELASWFDKVWRQGARVLIIGAMMGMIGLGGNAVLRTVANITITPVLFIGSELSMVATGISDYTQCNTQLTESDDVLTPVLQPFMCVMGNINSVMLAGAAGGFSLMNYAWLGMGGGLFTWLAGLGMVLLFLIIGFDLVFQVLSVIMKLVFLIIFLPLLLAAAAFEKTWSLAEGVVKNSINMLVESAIKIVAITLQVVILYAIISYAADAFFPGPVDNYSSIMPPMFGTQTEITDKQTLSVINVFATCEKASLVDGVVDADIFRNCFTAQRAKVENVYPGAFDFMRNGWDLILMSILLYLLYIYGIKPKVSAVFGLDKAGKEKMFDFGTWTKDFGKKLWNFPKQIAEKIIGTLGKK